MWVMNNAKGTEVYTKTAKVVEDFCTKMDGEWAVKVEVCYRETFSRVCTAPAKFELRLLDRERGYDYTDCIDWNCSTCVAVAVEYDDHEDDGTKREHYVLSVDMMIADGDDVKALELLIEVLNAWVEEEVFPNAVMAVDAEDLLRNSKLQGHLCEHGFNGYIASKAKCSKFKQ